MTPPNPPLPLPSPPRRGSSWPPRPRPAHARRLLAACGLAGALAWAVGPALAQPLAPAQPAQGDPLARPAPQPTDDTLTPYQDRPIREIRLEGLPAQDRQLVRNQIRSRAGTPLSAETVRDDVHTLNRLGRFKRIRAKAQPYDDGSIALIYEFEPTRIITDVAVSGNRQVSDTEIGAVVSLLKDTPVDEFQLGSARARILRLYRDKGYYNADVTIDPVELEREDAVVLFRVTEGERLRVTDIRFEGAASFSRGELMSVVKTRIAGILEKGPVDHEVLDQDVAALIAYYKDRGYLDVQADRQLVFAPNGREAIVKFLVREGEVYTLRSVRVESATRGEAGIVPLSVYTSEQIAGLMTIKPGDVYSVDKLRKSLAAIRNAYTQQGYVDVEFRPFDDPLIEMRDPDKPEVDLVLRIHEGRRYLTGLVKVSGNDVTKKDVVIREVEQLPDRPLNLTYERVGQRELTQVERRLSELRLFEPGSVRLTVQPEDPANPGYRDLLVQVKETNTGALTFGAAVTSDAGLIGTVGLNQRNFDWLDFPDSAGELFTGQAFRGAGQVFDLQLQPGTETQTYQISLSDPHLFDSDYSGSASGYFRTRRFRDFDEERLGARVALGRKFGERWTAAVFTRLENIDISDIDDDSIQDLFAVEGDNALRSVGFRMVRSTVDSRLRPTRGTRVSLDIERIGALGGDFDFTKLAADYSLFLTVAEDFLGYRTVLQLRVASAYMPEGQDDVPIFERQFLGGRTFRGFNFRTISPKGLSQATGEVTNDPAGGTFMFFAGAELERPLYQDLVSLALFVDTGTVEEEFGFDDYRVSAGLGIRLYVPALTPVPFAFDFGFPIIKRFGDEERVFSFSFDIPF